MKMLRIISFFVLFVAFLLSITELVSVYVKLAAVTVGFVMLLVSWVVDMRSTLIRSDRRSKMNLKKNLIAFLVLVIIVIVNYYAAKDDKVFDLSEAKRYTISKEVVGYLKTLSQPTALIGFAPKETPLARQMTNTFNAYSRYSDKLETKVVDPDIYPGLAKKYDVQSAGEVVMAMGDKWSKLQGFFERDVAIGIVNLTTGVNNICFSSGHGEYGIYNEKEKGVTFQKFIGSLTERGFNLIQDSIAGLDKRDDCDIVIILSPKKVFLRDELLLLKSIFDKDTGILILEDPFVESNINDFLNETGVGFVDGVILEIPPRIAGAPPTTVSGNMYLQHPIMSGITDITYFPVAKPLKKIKNSATENSSAIQFLVMTSNDSWLKTDQVDDLNYYVFEKDKDMPGPFNVAAAYSDEKGRKLVVFGDSDFINDYNYDYGDNSKLAENTLRWLLTGKENITLPKKELRDTRLNISENQLKWTKVAVLYPFPFIIFSLCFGIWYSRSR